MCIAIYKPKTKVVVKRHLRESFDSNPDGAGYVFAHKNRLYARKGYFTFREFWQDYRDDMKKYDEPSAAIHFRIATSGQINQPNCHPFPVGKDMALIHNGVIDCQLTDPRMSDTYNFCKNILTPLYEKFGMELFASDSFRTLLGLSVEYSKLVLLKASGAVMIINEEKGWWDDGVWYSNSTYLPRVQSVRSYNDLKNPPSYRDRYEMPPKVTAAYDESREELEEGAPYGDSGDSNDSIEYEVELESDGNGVEATGGSQSAISLGGGRLARLAMATEAANKRYPAARRVSNAVELGNVVVDVGARDFTNDGAEEWEAAYQTSRPTKVLPSRKKDFYNRFLDEVRQDSYGVKTEIAPVAVALPHDPDLIG